MKQQKQAIFICRYCNKERSSLEPCSCKQRTRWRYGFQLRLNSPKKRLRRKEKLNKKFLKDE